jgi:hypothetical protein
MGSGLEQKRATVSRSWKIGLAVFAAIVTLNVGSRILHSLTGGSPGGPTSSSYATGTDGLGAYFSLLAAEGHPVDRLRAYPAKTTFAADSTAVVLDPGFVGANDALALREFVEQGGRLVIGGAEPSVWLRVLLSPAPEWSETGLTNAHVLAPVPELAGDTQLRSANNGSWDDAGAALPVYGTTKGSLVAVASLGLGRVIFLADASVLQNQYLGKADNARFGLAAAGAPTRPVVFFESYHGYGPASGWDSIPTRWYLLLGGLALAAFALMIARGRRLGPPEAESRELPPPRRAYVDSLAGILARTKRPAEALEPVRAEAQARVARRAGLTDEATVEAIEAAARRIGLPDAEIDAMLGRPGSGDQVLAAGRALVHAGGTDARRDE